MKLSQRTTFYYPITEGVSAEKDKKKDLIVKLRGLVTRELDQALVISVQEYAQTAWEEEFRPLIIEELTDLVRLWLGAHASLRKRIGGPYADSCVRLLVKNGEYSKNQGVNQKQPTNLDALRLEEPGWIAYSLKLLQGPDWRF